MRTIGNLRWQPKGFVLSTPLRCMDALNRIRRCRMSLLTYRNKRNFSRTPEPSGATAPKRKRARAITFVIQKHDASRLHYDFRLELDGVLKSWAVPKGPSLDPSRKALAVQVEDHPLDYGEFEGVIPEGQYGGGTVLLWDRGTWDPIDDPHEGLKKGKLHFTLHGEKLHGEWALIRIAYRKGGDKPNWLLMKIKDKYAGRTDILEDQPNSVKSDRSIEDIADESDEVWNSDRSQSNGKHPGKSKAAKFAKSDPLPADIRPQLATWIASPPEGKDWLHEVKFDGYRMLCHVQGDDVRLITRGGNDWTHRFKRIAEELAELNLKGAIIDGEVVVLDSEGRSHFQSLQNAKRHQEKVETVLYAFDLLFHDGRDIREQPLTQRKARLQEILADLPAKSHLKYSEHIQGNGPAVVESACKMALEGIISKRADSRYVSGRTQSWLKSKCGYRQEFVIVGYSDPKGSRKGLGALLLGYHDKDGKLRYAGRVGTGFDERTLNDLAARLKSHARKSPRVDGNLPAKERRGAHWVEPMLVAEVKFNGWTGDGVLRQAAYMGLRSDKKPSQIVREEALPNLQASHRKPTMKIPDKTKSSPVNDDVRLTSPDKILFPEEKLTKADLANYYRQAAEWMLPHLIDRPLVLLRCPEGRRKQCFFQRNYMPSLPEAIHAVNVGEGRKKETHTMVKDLAGLISLVQIGALEIHTWGSTAKSIEKPDRLVFDLDPDEKLPWKRLVEAATELADLLRSIKLRPLVKLTGGKGIHLVVPLKPTVEWDQVKPFCKTLADELAKRRPEHYTTNMRKVERKGRIFIDYLRNGRGASAVAPYSVRAREGAPVSMPITWNELNKSSSGADFTLKKALQHLKKRRRDPWASFDADRVDLRTIFKHVEV